MMKQIALSFALLIALSVSAFASTGRPAGCPHAYCGCYLRMVKGINDTRLNLARNWASLYGSPASHGCVGCVYVMPHHVGLVTGYDAHGNIISHSGNMGHGIGTSIVARNRIIAYRS